MIPKTEQTKTTSGRSASKRPSQRRRNRVPSPAQRQTERAPPSIHEQKRRTPATIRCSLGTTSTGARDGDVSVQLTTGTGNSREASTTAPASSTAMASMVSTSGSSSTSEPTTKFASTSEKLVGRAFGAGGDAGEDARVVSSTSLLGVARDGFQMVFTRSFTGPETAPHARSR